MPDLPGATQPALLRLENVSKTFSTAGRGGDKTRGGVRAVDRVSLTMNAGDALAVVGESGCGKSTLSRLIIRTLDVTSGSVIFEGQDITNWSPKELRAIRPRMQMVFQDPYSSLDPRMTILDIVAEPLKILGRYGRSGDERVVQLLEMVGLDRSHLHRLPRQFSGGQRQRICVARALSVEPALLVLDEPVSALDVSIQAQILNLLIELRRDLGVAYLFVAHDLSVVRQVADNVAVMYLGRLVEVGPVGDVFDAPRHPYTRALLSAVPVWHPSERGTRERILLRGDPPSPVDPPSGCHFRTRCWKATDLCATTAPELTADNGRHEVACHFPETSAPVNRTGSR